MLFSNKKYKSETGFKGREAGRKNNITSASERF